MKKINELMLNKYLILSLMLFVFLFVQSVFIKVLLADVYAKKGNDLLLTKELELALDNFNKSITKNKFEPTYYKNRATCYSEMSVLPKYKQGKSIMKRLALADLKKGYSINPNNLKYLRDSTFPYYLIAYDEGVDSEYKYDTKWYFNDLKTRFRSDAGTLVDVAVYEKQLNMNQEYFYTLSVIYKLRPDLLKWYPGL